MAPVSRKIEDAKLAIIRRIHKRASILRIVGNLPHGRGPTSTIPFAIYWAVSFAFTFQD